MMDFMLPIEQTREAIETIFFVHEARTRLTAEKVHF